MAAGARGLEQNGVESYAHSPLACRDSSRLDDEEDRTPLEELLTSTTFNFHTTRYMPENNCLTRDADGPVKDGCYSCQYGFTRRDRTDSLPRTGILTDSYAAPRPR